MIYEYKCPFHGEFEIEHSINQKLEFCSKCKEEGKEQKVTRLISVSNFILVGGGWGKDNYK